MSSRGFLGAGDVYARFYDPALATFGDWQGPFETDKFEIKVSSDLKEMTSKGKDTYGQVIESVTIPKPNDFAIDFTEVNRTSMATALAGTTSSFSQSAGSLSDYVAVAKLDAWVDLGKENIIGAGFNVTNSAGTTTYVEGVDYKVNYRLGWLMALSTGDIVADASLKVDATYHATSGTRIAGATQSQIRAQFRLDGINFADQLPVIVDCLEAVIAPDAAFDFLQGDFAKVPLKGRLKTPSGASEPFTVRLFDAA
jgi:hypothetical protein